MLKRLFSFAMIVCCFTVVAMGQTTFEQSQSRIIEPKQDVFIKPLVAEIKIMNNEARQDFGPYEYEISSIDNLSYILRKSYEQATNMSGAAMMKEKSAAAFLESPRRRPPAMVEPERENPGQRERTWKIPTSVASLTVS